jgi:hypothetical protein
MCFENLQSSVVSLETKIEEPNSWCYVLERLQLAIFNNTSPFPEPKFMDLLYQKSSTFLTACGFDLTTRFLEMLKLGVLL